MPSPGALTALGSSDRDLIRPHAMARSTIEIGNAAAIEAVCSAPKPPAKSSTAATNPSPRPQITRNTFGGLSSPIDSIVVITSVPESEDVMNHDARSSVASSESGQLIQPTSPIQEVVPRFAIAP